MYRDIFLKSSNPTNVQNSNRSNFHWIHPREWGMGTPLLCGRRPHLPFSPLRQPPSNAATASRAPTHHNQLLPSQNGKTPRNAKPSRHETLGRAAAAAGQATPLPRRRHRHGRPRHARRTRVLRRRRRRPLPPQGQGQAEAEAEARAQGGGFEAQGG